jgi:raffinose/stachyose/melibiose transport system substrate-binding protein
MSIPARRPAGRATRRLLRPLSALGAVALTTSVLAACGSSGGASAKDTLNIVEWTNAAAVTYTQHIDSLFEKEHPGVTVNLQTAPTANAGWPTLESSVLASKNVDVLAEFPPGPAGYPPSYTGISTGNPAALVTSHQLVNMANEPFMKYYNKTNAEYAAGYDGGIYGVPAAEYVNNGGMWYKKSLLAKYHMKVPTTFNQFMADIKTFKAHGITPVFVAGKDGYQNILFAGIYNQLIMQDTPASQATTVSLNRNKAFWQGTQKWTDSVYQATAKEYEEVMRYIEPEAAGVSAQTAPAEWAVQSSNYPFFIDGSYDGNTITQASSSLSLGFFAFPGTNNPAWNRIPLAPDLTWTVPTWAKHKTLAMEWLSLFSRPSNYAGWVKATGSLSTETSVSTPSLKWTDWLSAHMSNAYDALTTPWAPNGAPTDATEPNTTVMQPIGSVSPTAELQASAKDYLNAVKGAK